MCCKSHAVSARFLHYFDVTFGVTYAADTLYDPAPSIECQVGICSALRARIRQLLRTDDAALDLLRGLGGFEASGVRFQDVFNCESLELRDDFPVQTGDAGEAHRLEWHVHLARCCVVTHRHMHFDVNLSGIVREQKSVHGERHFSCHVKIQILE